MTREEAIKVLEQVRLWTDYPKEAFTMAIESLQQPSLPEGLDEAAEEYAYNNWEDNDYHTGASEGLPFDAIGHSEKCFKAGAEWDRAKTMENAVEVVVMDDWQYGKDTDGAKPAIKVRNPDWKIGDRVKLIILRDNGV